MAMWGKGWRGAGRGAATERQEQTCPLKQTYQIQDQVIPELNDSFSRQDCCFVVHDTNKISNLSAKRACQTTPHISTHTYSNAFPKGKNFIYFVHLYHGTYLLVCIYFRVYVFWSYICQAIPFIPICFSDHSHHHFKTLPGYRCQFSQLGEQCTSLYRGQVQLWGIAGLTASDSHIKRVYLES